MINDELYGASFLDLFSGSGGIGIEALSRGARKARFCGEQPESCRLHPGKFKVHPAGLPTGKSLSWTFSERWICWLFGRELFVIFMDPPYNRDLEKEVLSRLKDSPLVTEETLLIVEASLETDFSYLEEFGYEVLKRKEYKTNVHLFLQRAKGADT